MKMNTTHKICGGNNVCCSGKQMKCMINTNVLAIAWHAINGDRVRKMSEEIVTEIRNQCYKNEISQFRNQRRKKNCVKYTPIDGKNK